MTATSMTAIRSRPRCLCASTASAEVVADATFSACRRYRYVLERRWDDDLPVVLFIGLNPSTADERADDPTVRRCTRFAKDWGFGSLILANLFALRSTDPRGLFDAVDPVGRWNDRWLTRLSGRAPLIVAAWGVHGSYQGRDRAVVDRLPDVHCLGTTKEGHPRHPLYLRADTRPQPFQI